MGDEQRPKGRAMSIKMSSSNRCLTSGERDVVKACATSILASTAPGQCDVLHALPRGKIVAHALHLSQQSASTKTMNNGTKSQYNPGYNHVTMQMYKYVIVQHT